jgi:hypothetical protein
MQMKLTRILVANEFCLISYLKSTFCFVSLMAAKCGLDAKYSEPPTRVEPIKTFVRSRLGENLINNN